jgi:hypothetical protein
MMELWGNLYVFLMPLNFPLQTSFAQEREHSSIIDYLLTSLPSFPRVQKVHVETHEQVRGANGCGSDHNLLWLDYSLDFDIPSWHAPPPKLMFDRIAFQKAETKKDYQEELTPLLNEWNAKVKNTLESSLFKALPLPVRIQFLMAFIINGHFSSIKRSVRPFLYIVSLPSIEFTLMKSMKL